MRLKLELTKVKREYKWIPWDLSPPFNGFVIDLAREEGSAPRREENNNISNSIKFS